MKSFTRVISGLFTLIMLLPVGKVMAQSFSGLAFSQNVITEVFSNPAFVVTDDDYQINMAGAGASAGNNAYYLKKEGFSSITGGVSNQYFYKTADRGRKAIWGNIDFLGPAASFKIKKKYYVAVTSRFRTLVNMDNLDNDVFRVMGSQPADTSKRYNVSGLTFNSQIFEQVGVSYGGIILANDENALRGGVTVNYMSGFGAAGLTVPLGSFKVDKNNLIHDAVGDVNVAFTPYANNWVSKGAPLTKFGSTPVGSGLGLDLGLVYEYSPIEGMKQQHGYLLRLAASITDIGSINYTASTTTGSYGTNDSLLSSYNIKNVDKDPNKTYSQTIYRLITDSAIAQKGLSSKFKMGLPTALHLNMDVMLGAHYYLNVSSIINLRGTPTSKYVSHYVTSFSLSPRYQSKLFSFGLPFTVNRYKKGNLGAIVSVGPFYIGSSSIFTPLVGSAVDNFDVFTGLHFIINKRRDY